MTEPWEQPTFAAAEKAAWDALAKATPEDLHHMGVTLGQAGVSVEEAAASIGAVWALASQFPEWQQPTTCLHTGDRITDQMIAEADPRIICADCGEQIIDEPATDASPTPGVIWTLPDSADEPWPKVVDLTGMQATFEEHVQRIVHAEHQMLEQACEAAIQTGTCGVRIIREQGVTTILIDNTVPYGKIYEETRGGTINAALSEPEADGGTP